MRALLPAVAILTFTFACHAQEAWQPFGVRQGGFVFDVPPGFSLQSTDENGTGAIFSREAGATLTVWGEEFPSTAFVGKVAAQLADDEAEGWNISYRRITTRWASYSGVKDGRIRYSRAIAVCNDRAAFFQLDYRHQDKVAYDPIVERMVDSLKAVAASTSICARNKPAAGTSGSGRSIRP